MKKLDKEAILNIKEGFSKVILAELTKCTEAIDIEDYIKAVKLINESILRGGRLHITGIGKPSHIASYAASLYSSTGCPAYFLDGTECVHGSAGQTKEGDVVIAISNSGNTNELLTSVKALKDIGVKIIGLTGNNDSLLKKEAEVTLLAKADEEGDNLNKAPRASIVNEIFVLQLLSLILQNERELTMDEYVKWHPGGSIGKSILGG